MKEDHMFFIQRSFGAGCVMCVSLHMKLTYSISKYDRSRTETQDGLEKRPLYTVTDNIWSWVES